jgi:hypothetical protein
MRLGTLAARPDLRPLFGGLSTQENDELLDRLLAIDRELVRLAGRASDHVGVPYEPIGLQLHVRPDGASSPGIAGGPSGRAGDIWFDISPADGWSGPPWVVESRLVVFCSDSPEPQGDANTHDLIRLEGSAASAAAVMDILEAHVETMMAEVEKRPRQQFTAPHSELP